MEDNEDEPEDVKKATPVADEIKSGTKDEKGGNPKATDKKKDAEKPSRCDKNAKKPTPARSEADCCRSKIPRSSKTPKIMSVLVYSPPCTLPRLDIIPRHCLSKQEYIDILAAPSRKCPPECSGKTVIRKIRPISARINELAQPARRLIVGTLQERGETLPAEMISNLIKSIEGSACMTPEQAEQYFRDKENEREKKGGKNGKQKCRGKAKSPQCPSQLDKEAVMCQYLMAERFVKSILQWKCPIPVEEFQDIAGIILRRLSFVLEYTPVDGQDVKSQQMRFLADIIACWISGVLFEVAEEHKKEIEEEMLAEAEEEEEDEEEEDDEEVEEPNKSVKEPKEDEDDDEETEKDEGKKTQDSGTQSTKDDDKAEKPIDIKGEPMDETENDAEKLAEKEKEKKAAEEKAIKEAEEKARKEAEEKARKEAEEKAQKEAEEKARIEAEEKKKKKKEQEEEEARLKAKQEEEEKKKKEAEEEEEKKKQKEAEEKKKRDEEEAEKKRKEEEEKLQKEKEQQEKKEEKKRQEDELKKKKEQEEEKIKELGPKDAIEKIGDGELFKTDIPFVTFGKILDTMYTMIEDEPEGDETDIIHNRIQRALYEKLSRLIRLEDPDSLTENLKDIADVLSGKVATWIQRLLKDSELKFLNEHPPEVESGEIRDWGKWIDHVTDRAGDWAHWIHRVVNEAEKKSAGNVNRGDWQNWTSNTEKNALLWRRYYLETIHQAHHNKMMIADRPVVKTGEKAPILTPEEEIKNTDLAS